MTTSNPAAGVQATLAFHSQTAVPAKPFLKWVGGKQQLLPQFADLYPPRFHRYFEAFLGGGAVFFHLWTMGRLTDHVCLSDNNDELVNVYLVVRDNLDALVDAVRVHEKRHDKAYYYQIRNWDRDATPMSPVARAARTIYLNRTCFNGLYRVNSKRQFNVPVGSYVNPKILHTSVLEAAHQALQHVDVEVRDFRTLADSAREGDFVYLDPPYHPLNATSSFTTYTADSFHEKDQQELAQLFATLSDKGCLCMLSNSHTPLILELYKKFRVEVVHAKRAVNARGDGRGKIQEVVVLNY